jgi:ABC-2 type transport system permease protein
MNTEVKAMHEPFLEKHVVATGMPASRVFYWSVRRELWENRSVYMAPIAVAAVVLVAFSVSSVLGIWEQRLRLVPSRPQMPYDMAAGFLMLTGIMVSVFYCLDALQSERRDRSILFWKSLPVSDITTVLAKASIPLVVVPLLTFAITIVMQWSMLLVSSAVLLVSGDSVSVLWRNMPVASMWALLLYHLVTAHAIWPFPIYCWLLLVSGWARRATFLWAVLPLVAIAGVEGIVFRTSHFAAAIGRRFIGDAPAMKMTPDSMGLDPLTTHVTVARFVTSPGFWLGLAIAAVFLAAAVRLRRYQGPI